MRVVHDVAQRSPEWVALRLGRLCGSKAADMLATVKSGEAAGRKNLRVALTLERLTGRPQSSGVTTEAMQIGTEREPEAVARYEAETGEFVSRVGFVSHPALMAGVSPDGVIGDWEGLLECKCPQPATHLDYLKTGIVPDKYAKQILHALWITGASWCDWISYHPDFPEALQTKLVRVHRDEDAIAAYAKKVEAFLAEVDAEVDAVNTLGNLAGQMERAVAAHGV